MKYLKDNKIKIAIFIRGRMEWREYGESRTFLFVYFFIHFVHISYILTYYLFLKKLKFDFKNVSEIWLSILNKFKWEVSNHSVQPLMHAGIA